MKKIFLLAGAMAMLVVSSCKKDNNSNDGNNNNGGSAKLLKKVTKTESGATTVYNLTYDGNKLTSLTSNDNLESSVFTFDGSGNIVKLAIRDNNDYSTYTYTYSDGIPVSGTVKTWCKVAGEPDELTQDDVITYTVVNGKVTKMNQQMKLDGVALASTLTYDSNGNLAKVQTEGDEPFAVTFTYGTKRSGFPNISKWVLDLGYTLQFYAKNETLAAFYDFPGTQFDETITTKYTYDAAGYPLTSDDGETQLKFEYQ
ncbi:MAG TPA: hypothetical protein VIM79_23795 [Niastella sp.]